MINTAHAEFKRYLREMNATVPYDRFEGENTYERLYRELGYGNLREDDEDTRPYTQSDSDRMIDEYFATIHRKKEKKIIGKRQRKEEDECFQRLAQIFNNFNEELL